MPEESREAEEFNTQILSRVAEEYYPELLDEIEDKLSAKIDNWIGTRLPGQTVNYDFNTRFEITDTEAKAFIEVDFGTIEGEHEVDVRQHQRSGRDVRGYTRTLSNQATFEIDGNFVTLDTIPEDIIIKEIISPVLAEYSDDIDDLANRIRES